VSEIDDINRFSGDNSLVSWTGHQLLVVLIAGEISGASEIRAAEQIKRKEVRKPAIVYPYKRTGSLRRRIGPVSGII
jgi:succinyl-CoA synthetase alpha subunit